MGIFDSVDENLSDFLSPPLSPSAIRTALVEFACRQFLAYVLGCFFAFSIVTNKEKWWSGIKMARIKIHNSNNSSADKKVALKWFHMLSSPAEHDPFNMVRQCVCVCARAVLCTFECVQEVKVDANLGDDNHTHWDYLREWKKLSQTHQQWQKNILHNKFIFILVVVGDVCSRFFCTILFSSHPCNNMYDIRCTTTYTTNEPFYRSF